MVYLCEVGNKMNQGYDSFQAIFTGIAEQRQVTHNPAHYSIYIYVVAWFVRTLFAEYPLRFNFRGKVAG